MNQTIESWRKRYDDFVERKTRAAESAALPKYVTGIDDHASQMAAIGNAWTRELFDGPFYLSRPRAARRPACSLVFVQSADGNTVADDPSTLGAGETDKHLVYEGLTRVAADAVLAGAGTVRGGEVLFSVWHPELIALRAQLGLPRHPVQVIVSARGLDVHGALLFNVPDIPAIVVTLPAPMAQMRDALAARPWVTAFVMGRTDELPEAFEHLATCGIRRVCCVGGRTLAGHLLDAHLVDDLCLTTSPRRGGQPDTPLFKAPWPHRVIVRKHGTGIERGVVFEQIVPAGSPVER